MLTRFFDEPLLDELCAVRPGEQATSMRAASLQRRAMASVDWFALKCAASQRRTESLEAVFAHIERGLMRVLRRGRSCGSSPGSSAP